MTPDTRNTRRRITIMATGQNIIHQRAIDRNDEGAVPELAIKMFRMIALDALPAAEPDKVKAEIEEVIGLDASQAVLTSAKSGIGIEETLEALVKRIPPPTGDRDAPLKAMLVDSWYDPYLGVVILVRVIDGFLHKGLNVRFMQGGTQHLVDRVRDRKDADDGYLAVRVETVVQEGLRVHVRRHQFTAGVGISEPIPVLQQLLQNGLREHVAGSIWSFDDEERVVGPSLGADSIAKGTQSVLIGLALVLIFMIASFTSVDAGIVVVPKEEPKVEKKKPAEPKKKVEKKELTAWERCCANDIDLSPLRNGFFIDHYKRSRGNFNFNIRFKWGSHNH
mgnify:CR=1 FL=1